MKYWQALLEKQIANGKSGLTIPFIIGSQKYLPDDSDRQGIRELICDIVKANTPIFVRQCVDLHELIFTLNPIPRPFYFTYNGKTQDKIGIMGNPNSSSIDEFISELEDKYDSTIAQEKYSCRIYEPNEDSKWQGFSSNDEKFITSAFTLL